ncbi:MAG: RnfH family protein [Neisseriaceae bacterium]|nr:RnfH family protein [Neisseriaceae bacterium]MCV2509671.1 RnfH family protein [Neisseriaceae bacterium]
MPKIWVEIVLALEDKQYLLRFETNEGTTIKEALLQTDLKGVYPEYFQDSMELGIFGMKVQDDYVLKNEDRIEIYRPLKVDPKQNRRIRSEKKNGKN